MMHFTAADVIVRFRSPPRIMCIRIYVPPTLMMRNALPEESRNESAPVTIGAPSQNKGQRNEFIYLDALGCNFTCLQDLIASCHSGPVVLGGHAIFKHWKISKQHQPHKLKTQSKYKNW
ncbi:hypothetical protein Zmor_002608 [Zophobas morio]|uniref:Uncharacterized protein n=1 Tax=Zophobas morio TaxID=2755281 RepID=A0AA38MUA8_9CUCU|nr:hypothetical protein Zmor_002608 [Zophobas morio]